MDVKLFEIRDRGTMIPALAIHLRNRTPEEFFLLRHAGYSPEGIGGLVNGADPYIILSKLDGVEAHYDPFEWSNMRTMGQAHIHIIGHWNELKSGDVVDIEFIMKEKDAPKRSEQITTGLL